MDNKREILTLRAMLKIYCRHHHGSGESLCFECAALFAYASKNIENCKLGHQKSVCSNCKIHCFKPYYREQIKTVMRFSGPKMIYMHPLLAITHLFKALKQDKLLKN